KASDLTTRLEQARRNEGELLRARRGMEHSLDRLQDRYRRLEQEVHVSYERRKNLEARLDAQMKEVARVHVRLTAIRREQEKLRLAAGHAGRALRLREKQLQRLGEHTVNLQRAVRTLLVSKG